MERDIKNGKEWPLIIILSLEVFPLTDQFNRLNTMRIEELLRILKLMVRANSNGRMEDITSGSSKTHLFKEKES